LFPGLAEETPSPAPRPRSARSANRAAWWEQDLNRSAAYLMGKARNEEERELIGRLYEQTLDEGADFMRYRSRSAFRDAPRLGIDRNAYARILNALELIERGTYRQCRAKGKQGIPRTVARVLKALLNLALKYGEVRPSQLGLARLSSVCKQTVVDCIKVLELYGFVIVHRRIKRIRTPLGFKVVQDTNAYTIQEPCGLGAMAVRLFSQSSESRRLAALSPESHSLRAKQPKRDFKAVPDGVFGNPYEISEARTG
jgi:hypothetical protein